MKKLVALFLCMVLCFSLVTSAGATDADSLLAQLRNGNSGAVTLPELTTNLWYANQISHEGGVEKHGQFGTWYFVQFNEDGTGYFNQQSFAYPYPSSVNLTWKTVSDTEVELVIGDETIPMTYDGEFLSFTWSGLTFQLASRSTELGQEIYQESENMSYSAEKGDPRGLEGVFKPVALFYATEAGVVFTKCSEETLPSKHMLYVEKDWSEENRYSVQLILSETNFDDVTTRDEADAVIDDSTRYSEYYSNGEVDSEDGISLENVTLQGDGKEMTIQSFYQQQWKQSYILQMEGVYFICMPLEYSLEYFLGY